MRVGERAGGRVDIRQVHWEIILIINMDKITLRVLLLSFKYVRKNKRETSYQDQLASDLRVYQGRVGAVY